MYALANVEKFVEDNKIILSDKSKDILSRAKELSCRGVISGGSVDEIMQDDSLASKFRRDVMNDPEHLQIGFAAIQKGE